MNRQQLKQLDAIEAEVNAAQGALDDLNREYNRKREEARKLVGKAREKLSAFLATIRKTI